MTNKHTILTVNTCPWFLFRCKLRKKKRKRPNNQYLKNGHFFPNPKPSIGLSNSIFHIDNNIHIMGKILLPTEIAIFGGVEDEDKSCFRILVVQVGKVIGV